MTQKLEGDRQHSVVIGDNEPVSSGQCYDMTWEYLFSQIVANGLVEEGKVLGQIDVHSNGVRLVVKDEEIKTKIII
jgi:hypothetical protein